MIWSCVFFGYILGCLGTADVKIDVTLNGFSITQFISERGYPVEAHVDIETEDGYLLDMFRIPHGVQENNATDNKSRPAALLMHGLMGSAENFVILGPDKSLAFLLADAGYDVWLGNARGTTHSRKHNTLNPDYDKEFWDFSWHEIGVFDLPAKLDYIMSETNQTEIFYIGHSQGTTSFFVMASERPDYNKNIKLMIALAPVAFMTNAPNPAIQAIALFERSLSIVSNLVGLNEFIPNNELLKLAGQAICLRTAITKELCANAAFLIAGYDSDQLDRSYLPIITQTTPSSCSIKQFAHYGQEINSGTFKKFDYGYSGNLERYGTDVPPSYDLSQITAPIALYYSTNDLLTSPKDVEYLATKLPNLVLKYLIPYESFNHLDFIVAKDVIPLLYGRVMDLMNANKI
ncbi:unnamed protein product [Brassicogethes aeneus]|uniref:Lipase n=1 Tax=Brassicogethes aeneus TaxID=1431903 RepID=A0A9P0AV59_BRAAE|nr:unnamed protein product [Brassicogethes aeneus]